MNPPYKTPTNSWFTKALFYEQYNMYTIEKRPSIKPVFTLYNDQPGLINARKTFVELGDPSGYKWAIKYLGDYDHWRFLMECSWFREAYEVWMNELNMKLQSEAIDRIKEIASNPTDKQSLVANKWLASKPWQEKTTNRGRPSKAELQGEMKRHVEALTAEEEDAKRIGLLKVVK